MSANELMGDRELQLASDHLRLRGMQAGDEIPQGHLVYVDPTGFQAVLEAVFSDGGPTASDDLALEHLKDQVQVLEDSTQAALILVPIWSSKPEHWSLLSFRRAAGGTFEAKHEDSLSPSNVAARTEAVKAHAVLVDLLGSSNVGSEVLGQTVVNVVQTGITCGLMTAMRMEEEYSVLRGAGFRRVYSKPAGLAAELNKLRTVVARKRRQAGLGTKTAGGQAGTGNTGGDAGQGSAGGEAGASSTGGEAGQTTPAGPPPLPPPSTYPQEALQLDQLTPLALLPPPSAGCGKCRLSLGTLLMGSACAVIRDIRRKCRAGCTTHQFRRLHLRPNREDFVDTQLSEAPNTNFKMTSSIVRKHVPIS